MEKEKEVKIGDLVYYFTGQKERMDLTINYGEIQEKKVISFDGGEKETFKILRDNSYLDGGVISDFIRKEKGKDLFQLMKVEISRREELSKKKKKEQEEQARLSAIVHSPNLLKFEMPKNFHNEFFGSWHKEG